VEDRRPVPAARGRRVVGEAGRRRGAADTLVPLDRPRRAARPLCRHGPRLGSPGAPDPPRIPGIGRDVRADGGDPRQRAARRHPRSARFRVVGGALRRRHRGRPARLRRGILHPARPRSRGARRQLARHQHRRAVRRRAPAHGAAARAAEPVRARGAARGGFADGAVRRAAARRHAPRQPLAPQAGAREAGPRSARALRGHRRQLPPAVPHPRGTKGRGGGRSEHPLRQHLRRVPAAGDAAHARARRLRQRQPLRRDPRCARARDSVVHRPAPRGVPAHHPAGRPGRSCGARRPILPGRGAPRGTPRGARSATAARAPSPRGRPIRRRCRAP